MTTAVLSAPLGSKRRLAADIELTIWPRRLEVVAIVSRTLLPCAIVPSAQLTVCALAQVPWEVCTFFDRDSCDGSTSGGSRPSCGPLFTMSTTY